MLVCALLMGQAFASPPKALNLDSFDQVKAYASPSANDLAFQALNWHPQVLDGLIEGHKQDKPVLMWMYFGDPRGHC